VPPRSRGSLASDETLEALVRSAAGRAGLVRGPPDEARCPQGYAVVV